MLKKDFEGPEQSSQVPSIDALWIQVIAGSVFSDFFRNLLEKIGSHGSPYFSRPVFQTLSTRACRRRRPASHAPSHNIRAGQ